MIEIEGLNKKQRMLADIIWSLDTQDQVRAFIASLPAKDRVQAQLVTQMMILAFIDEVNTIEPETVELINSFKE
jgi:hypothetical protein